MSLVAQGPQRRLLFLFPFPPRLDAPHGGGRVGAQLLLGLARQHRVAVLTLRGVDEPPVDDTVRARCEVVEEVVRPWSAAHPVAQLVRNGRLVAGLMHLRPMWASDFRSAQFAERVHALAGAWKPDVVHLEHHVMGQYLGALRTCVAPRVLTEHEPGVRAAPYLKRTLPLVTDGLQVLDTLAWKHFEPRILRQVQATIVFTRADQRVLERLVPGARVAHIPFGTLVPDRALDPLGRRPHRLLFIGSYVHPPNIDAALRLARVIFPRVRARLPGVHLDLVGECPPPELARLQGVDISVTGRVPDVQPYLDGAAAFIVPIATGGGMRVKVLEALAAGKAVVASTLATEGLDVQDGEQLYIADTDAEFVDRTVELLSDGTRRAALATRARAWAVEHLGWSSSLAAYEQLYDSLVEVARPDQAAAREG